MDQDHDAPLPPNLPSHERTSCTIDCQVYGDTTQMTTETDDVKEEENPDVSSDKTSVAKRSFNALVLVLLASLVAHSFIHNYSESLQTYEVDAYFDSPPSFTNYREVVLGNASDIIGEKRLSEIRTSLESKLDIAVIKPLANSENDSDDNFELAEFLYDRGVESFLLDGFTAQYLMWALLPLTTFGILTLSLLPLVTRVAINIVMVMGAKRDKRFKSGWKNNRQPQGLPLVLGSSLSLSLMLSVLSCIFYSFYFSEIFDATIFEGDSFITDGLKLWLSSLLWALLAIVAGVVGVVLYFVIYLPIELTMGWSL